MKRPYLSWLAAAICSVAAHAQASEAFVTLDEPRAVAPFSLHDQHGAPFSDADLLGQWSLIFLGFTSCPDVCPMTMLKLEAVRAELGQRLMPDNIPNIIFLAVDPARDKEVLAGYLQHFHPQNIGITGEPEQIGNLVGSLDGFYRLNQPKPGSTYYDVTHTAAIVVINAQNNVVAKLNPPFNVHPMAEFLTQLIRRAPSDV